MPWHILDPDGLVSPDDPCLDTVLPAAQWGALHPREFGRAITTATTTRLGIAAAAEAQTALESARALNDWFDGVSSQDDLNHQIGAWAGPPLSALGVWGACHATHLIDAWGTSPEHASIVPALDLSSDFCPAPGIAAGDGFGGIQEAPTPFDGASSSVQSASGT